MQQPNARRLVVMAMDSSVIQIQRAWQDSTRQALHPTVEAYFRDQTESPIPRAARLALLQLAEHGPLHVTELAGLCAVDVSTMSRTVRTLFDAGLVTREADTDLRAVRLAITAEGLEAIARLIRASQELIESVLVSWTPEDREQLALLMARFSEDFAAHLGHKPQFAHAAGAAH
jgi:DNA-binding MarR family transcriptional regulator